MEVDPTDTNKKKRHLHLLQEAQPVQRCGKKKRGCLSKMRVNLLKDLNFFLNSTKSPRSTSWAQHQLSGLYNLQLYPLHLAPPRPKEKKKKYNKIIIIPNKGMLGQTKNRLEKHAEKRSGSRAGDNICLKQEPSGTKEKVTWKFIRN